MADFSVVPPGSFPSDPTANDGTQAISGGNLDFLSGLGDFLDTASGAFSDAFKAFNAPTAVTIPAVKNAPAQSGVNGSSAAPVIGGISTNMLLFGGVVVLGAVVLAKLV